MSYSILINNGEVKYLLLDGWYTESKNDRIRDTIIGLTLEDLKKLLNKEINCLDEIFNNSVEFGEEVKRLNEKEYGNQVVNNENTSRHKINDSIKNNIYAKSMYCCWYCGKDLSNDKRHIDHVIPKSKGGNNNLENLVLSCPRCNSQKNDMNLEEYKKYLTNKKKFCGIFYGESL